MRNSMRPHAMLGDFRIAELTANRTQRRERALFVLAHQPRIAGDIDRQNRRQPSLDSPFAHLASQSHAETCGRAYDGTQPNASATSARI